MDENKQIVIDELIEQENSNVETGKEESIWNYHKQD
jgi:hypothetical protein